MARLYVASSWRNPDQPAIVELLRSHGHEVYDFRNPPGRSGFGWEAIDGGWQSWDEAGFLSALETDVARAGFLSDFGAMEWADAGVLVLPSGRSAHLEAGYFVGARKHLFVLLGGELVPELTYLAASAICRTPAELVSRIQQRFA